jgi:hypothetical protein
MEVSAPTAVVREPTMVLTDFTWPRFWRITLAVVAAFCIAALWLAVFYPSPARNWLGESVFVPTPQLRVVQGTAVAQPRGLVQLNPSGGRAVVEINVAPLTLESYPSFQWSMRRNAPTTQAQLEWSVNDTIYTQPFEFDGNEVDDVLRFQSDSRWVGRPTAVRLVVVGDQPVLLGTPVFLADSVQARLALMVDGWFGFQPWKLSDLNFIDAVDKSGNYYFNVVLHIAVLGVFTLFALQRWWQGRAMALSHVAMILLAGCALGALRWSVDLAQKSWDSYQRFGGKTLHEKHLAADDHEYYWVVESLRPHVKSSGDKPFSVPFVIYFNATERYDAGKLRYYTAPHPLKLLDAQPAPGTVFGVVNAPHQFDASKGALVIANNIVIPVTKLGERAGAAIYRAQ